MKPVLPVTKIMPTIISDEELGILLHLNMGKKGGRMKLWKENWLSLFSRLEPLPGRDLALWNLSWSFTVRLVGVESKPSYAIPRSLLADCWIRVQPIIHSISPEFRCPGWRFTHPAELLCQMGVKYVVSLTDPIWNQLAARYLVARRSGRTFPRSISTFVRAAEQQGLIPVFPPPTQWWLLGSLFPQKFWLWLSSVVPSICIQPAYCR